MPRTATPFVAGDLSSFARALSKSLVDRHARAAPPPGHVEMLNLIARAAGHRNLQSLKAAVAPVRGPVAAEDRLPDPPLTATARKALMQFDSRARLVRWPNKLSVQRLAMWVLWTRFDARRTYTEAEVNAVLRDAQTYGDHVTLRRELINHRLMARESDCSAYWKLPARPDPEARALLRAWRAVVREAPSSRRAPPPPADAAVTAAPR